MCCTTSPDKTFSCPWARSYKVLTEITSVSKILHSDTQTVSSSFCCFYKLINALSRSVVLILDSYQLSTVSRLRQWAAMPSELETAMESLIMVFHRYAGKEGKSGTLTRRELRTLMEHELSGFLKVKNLRHLLTNTIDLPLFIFQEKENVLSFIKHILLPTVSEGSNHHRQNYEGLGCQWRWGGEFWRVCVFGCGFVHCLWGVLQNAVKEDTKLEMKRNMINADNL